MSEIKRGWGKPGFGRKWHYFDERNPDGLSFSLCGNVGFYYGPLEEGNDNSPDNCAECKRRKAKLDAAPPEEVKE
jgi:hypothetical protein